MNRRGFLKRMAFAALACGFLELDLPTIEPEAPSVEVWVGDILREMAGAGETSYLFAGRGDFTSWLEMRVP